MIYKDLDNKIKSAIEIFESQVEDIRFPTEQAIYFRLNEELTELNLPDAYMQSGVYFFEMKLPSGQGYGVKTATKLQNIIKQWRHSSVRKLWSPDVRQIRLNAHFDKVSKKYTFESEWIPFYIGKSRNVAKRIREHIFQEAHKTTFGMKLKARKNIYGLEFRVSTIPITVQHYDIIVPHVERLMRNKLNPIVGKQ